MLSLHHLIYVILFVLLYHNNCCLGWKPIVGHTARPATVFSFQNSHLGSSIKSYNTLTHAEIPLGSSADPSFDEYEALSLASVHSAIGPDATVVHDDIFGYKYGGESRDFTTGTLGEDSCAVKKYAFNHDGTVQYNNKISELEQFTICYWMRFTNHSGDHVMLTYSAGDEKRAFQFWVANSKNSSFLSMAIKGQQIYRLNYPLRVRTWHHTCTSWNGKTGEWQVWLKAERIGRGFHNAVVGYKISSNGKLFSGGLSATGKPSEGLHFEMTLVQIYRVALSAGKAHRDHKHHHAHRFDHEGQEVAPTTKAPPRINRPLPMHSLLASGQIPTNVRINLAQQATPSGGSIVGILPSTDISNNIVGAVPEHQGLTINTNFINGQFHTGSRLVTQQLIGLPAGPSPRHPSIQTTSTKRLNSLTNPANVQFVDETETRIVFKRQALSDQAAKEAKTQDSDAAKTVSKRELVLLQDGSIVDDSSTNGFDYQFDGLAEFGGQKFKQSLNMKMNIEDEIKEHDREPAEEEVRAVMALCGSCDLEPFEGAIVFAWKDAHAEPDNALKGTSVGRCGNF